MCDVVTALKVGTAIYNYQNEKAIAKGKRIANDKTRENADANYLANIAKIDNEKNEAAMEKTTEELRNNMAKKAEQATGLNLGFGNATRILQSVSGKYDMSYADILQGYRQDMTQLMSDEDAAYANLVKTYNSIKPVTEPSRTGLALQIATISAEGVAKRDANTAPETGRAPEGYDEL
ncbi:MAG: hypothetical protein VW946_05790 [Gammaproteobacteria bacterium]